jgi:hypothetical protein
VMQPLEGQTFGISRPMSGAEAVEAVERLTRLAAGGGSDGGASERGGRRD